MLHLIFHTVYQSINSSTIISDTPIVDERSPVEKPHQGGQSVTSCVCITWFSVVSVQLSLVLYRNAN